MEYIVRLEEGSLVPTYKRMQQLEDVGVKIVDATEIPYLGIIVKCDNPNEIQQKLSWIKSIVPYKPMKLTIVRDYNIRK